MKLHEFKSLKDEIENKDFHANYQSASKILFYLSFIGNLFSILFAYFFVYNIINSTVLEPTSNTGMIVGFITVVVLVISEVTKRFVFDKFSKTAIKERGVKTAESKILSFLSILLITLSFYLSLNGAQEYSAKDAQIQDNVEIAVEDYEDSLKNAYNIKIEEIEQEIKVLKDRNLQNDTKIDNLTEKAADLATDNWADRSEKNRIQKEIAAIRKDKKTITDDILKDEAKITELKEERDTEVSEFAVKQEAEAKEIITENKDNPARFIIFSSIIEFIILLGIFFINYYKIRSVREYEEMIQNDPKYKNFIYYSSILDAIYMKGTKVGEYIMPKTEIIKLLKMESVIISDKEISDALRIMSHLEILSLRGSKRELRIDREEAEEKIKMHFGIK